MRWWNRLPETVRDAVGAIPLILVFVVAQQIYGDGGSLPRAVVIVAVIGLAVTFRRKWPLASYIAALLLMMVAQTGIELLCVVSYTLVAYEPRTRLALVAGASACAALIGHLQYWPSYALEDIAPDLVLIAVASVAPLLVGRAVRQYRHTAVELAARNAELVRRRGQDAEHAVQTERLRIARELHDVVAHHISAMTVRARAGRHVAAGDPQAATDALAYIAQSGTATLTAMRTFVGALRDQAATGDATDHGLAPQPGLDDVPTLLESFRGTGLVVHADVDEPPPAAAPALGLNTYRIVQEALTNAIRHGAAERVWVRLWLNDGSVRIQVDDNGRGLRTDGWSPGHGLVGIAERVALHGGTSRLGPSPRGGCRLEATLTLDTSEPDELETVDLPGVRS